MGLGLTIYFIISAIITCVLSYFMSENNADWKAYSQSILFGWLFIILVVLYTILLICKITIRWIINKLI